MMSPSFNQVSVTDTCAIWHLTGCATLFSTARQRKLSFVITSTVFYECFVRSRGKALSEQRLRLRDRLKIHIQRGDVSQIDVAIDDLQNLIGVARQHGYDTRLGHGELSCAALARRLRYAVLTDNKRDFRAIEELADGLLQTTPRLLGWLYLDGHLTDGDVKDIIEQHRDSGGQMGRVYEQVHHEACEKRLVRHTSGQRQAGRGRVDGLVEDAP